PVRPIARRGDLLRGAWLLEPVRMCARGSVLGAWWLFAVHVEHDVRAAVWRRQGLLQGNGRRTDRPVLHEAFWVFRDGPPLSLTGHPCRNHARTAAAVSERECYSAAKPFDTMPYYPVQGRNGCAGSWSG